MRFRNVTAQAPDRHRPLHTVPPGVWISKENDTIWIVQPALDERSGLRTTVQIVSHDHLLVSVFDLTSNSKRLVREVEIDEITWKEIR